MLWDVARWAEALGHATERATTVHSACTLAPQANVRSRPSSHRPARVERTISILNYRLVIGTAGFPAWAHLPLAPRPGVGLLSRGSQVRVLPGAPTFWPVWAPFARHQNDGPSAHSPTRPVANRLPELLRCDMRRRTVASAACQNREGIGHCSDCDRELGCPKPTWPPAEGLARELPSLGVGA
jgi:hypothetical protein